MKQIRTALLSLCALALSLALAHAQSDPPKPWEEAALNALKAINSGDADLFLAWTHPAELYRLKQKFMEDVLTPKPGAPSLQDQLRPYGIRSVDELARMSEAAFAAVAIPHQYSANDAASREAMRLTTFRIIKSRKVRDDHYEVYIAIHVPIQTKPLDQDVVANVVKDQGGWRYVGLQ